MHLILELLCFEFRIFRAFVFVEFVPINNCIITHTPNPKSHEIVYNKFNHEINIKIQQGGYNYIAPEPTRIAEAVGGIGGMEEKVFMEVAAVRAEREGYCTIDP